MPSSLTRNALLALALFSSASALAADHQVQMLNQGTDGMMTFEPAYLAVQPGDTVTFVPTDAAHNSRSVLSPENGSSWNGGMGQKVTVTLQREGIYLYQCDPHIALGMVGIIQVGEAVNLKEARQQAQSMVSQISVNKERLGQYLGEIQ